jgi:hypothetical protein
VGAHCHTSRESHRYIRIKSMRIAYISYEYPPESANGGIATYIGQISRVMVDRGVSTERSKFLHKETDELISIFTTIVAKVRRAL